MQRHPFTQLYIGSILYKLHKLRLNLVLANLWNSIFIFLCFPKQNKMSTHVTTKLINNLTTVSKMEIIFAEHFIHTTIKYSQINEIQLLPCKNETKHMVCTLRVECIRIVDTFSVLLQNFGSESSISTGKKRKWLMLGQCAHCPIVSQLVLAAQTRAVLFEFQ